MNSTNIAMVNGDFIDAVSVNDRGLAFGDGVFETMRFENRRLPFLALHLQRLRDGCERLQIGLDVEHLRDCLARFQSHLADHGNDSGVIRITVTRGVGGKGVIPPEGASQAPTQILSFRRSEYRYDSWFQEPAELVLSDYILPSNPHLAGIKHLNRLDYILAALHTPLQRNQQLVLLDAGGHVIETLHHNVFCVLENKLVTPLLDNTGVIGIARRLLVEQIAPDLNMDVEIRPLSVQELNRAEEVFLTNAVAGVVPAGKLGTRNLSDHARSKQVADELAIRANRHAS